jgi:hypothetical protein
LNYSYFLQNNRSATQPEVPDTHLGFNEENKVLQTAFSQLSSENLLHAVQTYSEVVDNILRQQTNQNECNPVIRSMEMARRGVARINCPGHASHGAKCVVKSAGMASLKGYNEIEEVDKNDFPTGKAFFIGSDLLWPVENQSLERDLAEENKALYASNDQLVAQNLQLQEQLRALKEDSTQPTPGTSTSVYGNTESSSSEVSAVPLVTTREVSAMPLLTIREVSASPLVTTRPVTCDICGRGYGNRHSLATHKNRIHKMQHCEHCNGDFERSLFSGHTCQ